MHIDWKNKPIVAYLVLFIGSVILASTFSPWVNGFGYDREVYRYSGMLITLGKMPYTDLFYDKPPILHLINAAVHWMGPWGLWFAELLLMTTAACMFYALARRRSWFMPIVQALCFLIFIRAIPEAWKNGGRFGDTRSICTLLFIPLFALLVMRHRFSYYLAGALFAIIPLTQQEMLLPVLACAALLLFTKDTWRQALWQSLVGIALVVVPIFVWLAVKGAFGDFWLQCVVMPISFHVPTEGKLAIFAKLPAKLWQFYLVIPLLLLPSLLWRCKDRLSPANLQERAAIVFGIATLLYTISISGRFMWDYFLPLVPFVALTAAIISTQLWQRFGRTAALAFLAVVYLMPMVPVGKALHASWWAKTRMGYYDYFEPIRSIVGEVAGKEGQFLHVGHIQAIAINTDLNIAAPTRWIAFHYPNVEKTTGGIPPFNLVLQDIEAAKTKYILDDAVHRKYMRPHLKQWQSYRDAHYRPILSHPLHGTLLVRSDK